MRLNRVLQLTAGVAIAMAATVFTVSCSGEDGSDGANGTNRCTVSGNTVLCNGSEVGTLASGVDGAPGQQGSAGTAGTACVLGSQTGSSFEILCGGQLKGTLNGCGIDTTKAPSIEISCGGSTTITACKGITNGFEVYDVSKNECDIGTKAVVALKGNCKGGVKYNSQKQYCGFATKAAFDAKNPTPLDLCGDESGDNKPNEADSNVTTNLWQLAISWGNNDKVPGGIWASIVAGATAWHDEYCNVTRTGFTFDDDDNVTGVVEVKAKAIPVTCGASLTKFNEGSWKGEYCGYNTNSNATGGLKTTQVRVSNACGDGGTPDKDVFGEYYCKMESKTSKYTVASKDFCEVAGTGTAVTLTSVNEVKKFTLLAASDWKNQYCGFADSSSSENDRRSVRTGVCDDGSGPNDLTTQGNWKDQYCQADFDSISINKTWTKVVGGSEAYCAGERLNENTWKNQYCGFESKASAEAEELSVLTGVCGDGAGPNADTWENGYCQYDKSEKKTLAVGGLSKYCGVAELPGTNSPDGRMNEGSWKDEYCGFASKAAFDAVTKSVLSGKCTGDDGEPNSESSSTWNNEYCQVAIEDKATGKTKKVGINASSIYDVYCLADTTDADYEVAPASARLNEKTWQNQYCGFESKTNFEASPQVFSKLTGICDDKTGPNNTSAAAWTNDYCQADKTGTTTSVSGAAGATSIYCIEGPDFATAPASARLNENTWKGQYCFDDNAIGVCPGGQAPISGSVSTDSPKCAFE